MRIFRFSLPFFAFSAVLFLYWMLYQTIIISPNKKLQNETFADINFIRILQESQVQKKQRIKKEIPKQKPLKKLQQLRTNVPTPKIQEQKLDISIPLQKLPLHIHNNDFLKGAALLQPQFTKNSDAVAIVRIPPIYPRRAKMLRKEGFVKLKLFISKEGLVIKAIILESQPRKLFDQAALQSVHSWKFRPKYVNDKPIEQTAIQVVEFKLRK
jgi:protein TonB